MIRFRALIITITVHQGHAQSVFALLTSYVFKIQKYFQLKVVIALDSNIDIHPIYEAKTKSLS